MTNTASVGRDVLIDVDEVPTAAKVTHVHGAHEDGYDVVDLTAFPREAGVRHFAGVHLHPDSEAAAGDEHNLVAYWPGDEPVDELVDDVEPGDQGDEPAAAPVAAKKAPAKKAAARR